MKTLPLLLMLSGASLAILHFGYTRQSQLVYQSQRPRQSSIEYSCSSLELIPAEDVCTFVKSCDSDSRIPYAELYYCYVQPRGVYSEVAFMIVLLLLALPLFFTLLCDSADIFICPTMALLSQAIPGLKPRVAGVTFVAIGNGAPDLSSNINAIKAGNVLMSAGALTGAAMFVQCIVASEVIRLAEGMGARGAMLRDIALYMASVMGILVFMAMGQITMGFVVWALSMYLTYVLSVFAGEGFNVPFLSCWGWVTKSGVSFKPTRKFNWLIFRDALLDRDVDETVLLVVESPRNWEPQASSPFLMEWKSDGEAMTGEGEADDPFVVPHAQMLGTVAEEAEGSFTSSVPFNGVRDGSGAVYVGDEEDGSYGALRASIERARADLVSSAEKRESQLEDYSFFSEEPDLDLPMGSAEDFEHPVGVAEAETPRSRLTRSSYRRAPAVPPAASAGSVARGAQPRPQTTSFFRRMAPFLFQAGSGDRPASQSRTSFALVRGSRAALSRPEESRRGMERLNSPGSDGSDASDTSSTCTGVPSMAATTHGGDFRRSLPSRLGWRPSAPEASAGAAGGSTSCGGAPPQPTRRTRRQGAASKLIDARTYMFAVWADHINEDVAVEVSAPEVQRAEPVRQLLRAKSDIASLSPTRALSTSSSTRRQAFRSFALGSASSGGTRAPSLCVDSDKLGTYERLSPWRSNPSTENPPSPSGQNAAGRPAAEEEEEEKEHALEATADYHADDLEAGDAAAAAASARPPHPPPCHDRPSVGGRVRTRRAGHSRLGRNSFVLLRSSEQGEGHPKLSRFYPGSPSFTAAHAEPPGGSSHSSFHEQDRRGRSVDSSVKERDLQASSADSSFKELDLQGSSAHSSLKERDHQAPCASVPGLAGEEPPQAAVYPPAVQGRGRISGDGDGGHAAAAGPAQPQKRNSNEDSQSSRGALKSGEGRKSGDGRSSGEGAAGLSVVSTGLPRGSPARSTGTQTPGGDSGGGAAAMTQESAGASAAHEARKVKWAVDEDGGPLSGGGQTGRFANVSPFANLTGPSLAALGRSIGGGAGVFDSDNLGIPLLGEDGAFGEDEVWLEHDAEEGPGDEAPMGWFQLVLSEVTAGASEEWEEQPLVYRILRFSMLPVLLPVYTLMSASIPMLDPASYSCPWLLVTMACGPVMAACYLNLYTQPEAMAGAAAIGVVLWALAYLVCRGRERHEVPTLTFGTRMDFAPAFVSCMGFVVGIMWVDTIASEVVGILGLSAALLHVPHSVMGLTLMAWGNSLQDLAGNTSLALNGLPSMALTACIASPLFNMLVSMAVGFWSLLGDDAADGGYNKQGDVVIHDGIVHVKLTADVALGCCFLAIFSGIMMGLGLATGSIPKRFYLFARVWYGLYFVLACSLGFNLLDPLLPEWMRSDPEE